MTDKTHRQRIRDDYGYTAVLLDLDSDGYAKISYEPGQFQNAPGAVPVATHPVWVPTNSISRIV